MTTSLDSQSTPTGLFSGVRFVAKARGTGRKGYVWEIVREQQHPQPLAQRSSELYTTMEEAYTHGSVALAGVRARS